MFLTISRSECFLRKFTELQSKRGRKVSLNEAIKHLINIYRSGERDIPRMLSFFACLSPELKARALLKELRAEEEERLERKYRDWLQRAHRILMGTKVGETIREYFETLKPEETVNCSILAIREIFYVLCRLRGVTFAENKINDMLRSQC